MSTISGSGDGPNTAATQADRLAERPRVATDRGGVRSDSQEPFATLISGADPVTASVADSLGESTQSNPLSLLAPQTQNTLFQARASETSSVGAASAPQSDDPVDGLLKQFFDISNKAAGQAMSVSNFSNTLPLQQTGDE